MPGGERQEREERERTSHERDMRDGGPRRAADDEIWRVHETLVGLTQQISALAGKQSEALVVQATSALSLSNLQASIGEMKGAVNLVPQLERRIWLLERIVFGACIVILMAFVTALVSGVFKPVGP